MRHKFSEMERQKSLKERRKQYNALNPRPTVYLVSGAKIKGLSVAMQLRFRSAIERAMAVKEGKIRPKVRPEWIGEQLN